MSEHYQSLPGLDQFHVGGLAATIELARRAGLTRGMRVLDAGSGLGGPSRYLAETIGCDVIGVDLTPAYVATAAALTDSVNYSVGSILELPFESASFDIVWSQHVVMNIPERVRLYRELRRVLKLDGRFVFYDVYAPDKGEAPYFPVPWAETPAASTLLTKDATVAAMEAAGFRVLAFDDVTEIGLQQQRLPLDERMRKMVVNFTRNLTEGRVRLVMGACA